jgi:hypothetical protein
LVKISNRKSNSVSYYEVIQLEANKEFDLSDARNAVVSLKNKSPVIYVDDIALILEDDYAYWIVSQTNQFILDYYRNLKTVLWEDKIGD